MIFFIGGNSRIARALQKEFTCESMQILTRAIYENWWDPKSIGEINLFFKRNAKSGDIIIISSGILDPSRQKEDLLAINFFLPKNIIDAVQDLNVKTITFGTIMEKLIIKKNNYIFSKNKIGEYAAERSEKSNLVTHFRLHTLYGDYKPDPFMFLGQIVNSMRSENSFNMTQGRQLREYHHIRDEASALLCLINSNITGIVELSHGEPVRLRDLAEAVFSYFNKNHLLKIGSLPEPPDENFDNTQNKNSFLEQHFFRPTIVGVIEYLVELNIFEDKS